MNSSFVRRGALLPAVLAMALTLSACEDERLKQLDTGISRDSVLTVIAQNRRNAGRLDSLPSVYHKERYFVGGKLYEVFFFDEENKKAGRDTVEFEELTPIVMIDNVMAGKGWDYFDSLSKANNIPLKKRD